MARRGHPTRWSDGGLSRERGLIEDLALAPMYMIVPPDDQERWLAGVDAADLLRALPDELLAMWPASIAVNKVRNEGAELWEEQPAGAAS